MVRYAKAGPPRRPRHARGRRRPAAARPSPTERRRAMALTDIWFLLIAVLWTGYFVLEGFDFGVGMLLPLLGRDETDRRVADQHHRPGLGRQRGLAARRRRRHLRRLPRVVRDPVLRLLPGAAADPVALILRGVAFEFRGKIDSDRWRRSWDLRDHRRLGAARAAAGAWRSRTSCTASRSTRTTSTPAPSDPAQPVRAARRPHDAVAVRPARGCVSVSEDHR